MWWHLIIVWIIVNVIVVTLAGFRYLAKHRNPKYRVEDDV